MIFQVDKDLNTNVHHHTKIVKDLQTNDHDIPTTNADKTYIHKCLCYSKWSLKRTTCTSINLYQCHN